MGEDSIYPQEFVLLVLWLCAPAVTVVVAVLFALFARRGFFRPGQRLRSTMRIAVGVVATLCLSVPFWVLLPPSIAAPSFGGDQLVPVFLPSFVAALLVVPLVYLWAALRGGSDKSHVPSA